MNAPISAALLQLRANAPSQSLQPAVPPHLTCLMRNYLHDNVYVDLFGHADEDEGCSVEAVAVTVGNESVDISAFVTPAQMKQMAWVVDRAAVRAKQAARDEERADLHRWQSSA